MADCGIFRFVILLSACELIKQFGTNVFEYNFTGFKDNDKNLESYLNECKSRSAESAKIGEIDISKPIQLPSKGFVFTYFFLDQKHLVPFNSEGII